MNGWVGPAVAVIVAALVVWALAAWLRDRSQAQAAQLRQELQTMLAAQAQTVATQIGQLTQTVTQQLGQVGLALQKGVADSGFLVSKAQEAVAGELKNSREMLGRIQEQLGAVQQAGRELSQASEALQRVLSGAKTRGALGEVALERMLEDALPRLAYETQYRFSTGATVDAILRVGDKIVSVDSKFPLDAYRRMIDAAEAGRETARREFAKAVRTYADAVAEKYIAPAEGTVDYAFMFVPSEGVYYEFLMTEDPRAGSLAEYCRHQRVIVVSPNVFYAYLHTILMGLRGMQIEQRARELLSSLAGLRDQVNLFAGVYEKLGTHLRYAQQNYEEADHKLERARAMLDQMAQGALPETPAPALEAASKE